MRPLRERGNQGVSRNARPATNTGASPFARTFEARRSPRRPSWTPSASLSANRYRVAAKLERRKNRSRRSHVKGPSTPIRRPTRNAAREPSHVRTFFTYASAERTPHRSTTSAVISGGGNGTGRGFHPPG